MALAQDIANSSIRDSIRLIAEAVDKIQPADTSAVSALSVAVSDLKAEVKALNIAINGEPAAPVTPEPSPTAPVV
jgi:hypothetical protein